MPRTARSPNALAAGNTVVLKPAPDTPWCAAVLGRLLVEETGLPPGVVNIVTGRDHALGALLAADPRVDLVSFTGSTAPGRAVMRGALGALAARGPNDVLDIQIPAALRNAALTAGELREIAIFLTHYTSRTTSAGLWAPASASRSTRSSRRTRSGRTAGRMSDEEGAHGAGPPDVRSPCGAAAPAAFRP
nr:aldehyde dehydrogenase family protein [Nonomuraea sp. FMUSA5-5]